MSCMMLNCVDIYLNVGYSPAFNQKENYEFFFSIAVILFSVFQRKYVSVRWVYDRYDSTYDR